MNISREEALASLSAIQQTRAKMNKLAGTGGYFFIVWGLVWFCGCLSMQYLSNSLATWVWVVTGTIGWILSAILGIRMGKQAHSGNGSRVGLFFLALFVFAGFWLFLLQPSNVEKILLFIVTLFAFGGVVAGIMTRALSSVIISLSLAILTIPGYYLLHTYFYLWTAIFYGLTMVGIGLIVRLRWR